MDRKLQRHRADSLRQHGFLVLLPCHRQMERFTTKCHRLWYNQHFQELAQQVEEESDGLLYGPAGPPGPMALSLSSEGFRRAGAVRPHMVIKQPGKTAWLGFLLIFLPSSKSINVEPYRFKFGAFL